MADEYNVNHVLKVGHLKQALQDTKTRLADTLKFVSMSGYTINFYKTADGSGDPFKTLDLPAEFVLDTTKTTPVKNFAWSEELYPDSTNPNMDGHYVLVLCIKTESKTGTTYAYSFVDLNDLIDVYEPGNASILINGKKVSVQISAGANNALTLAADGLFVDISGKADKDKTAAKDEIAIFDENGNPVTSKTTFATDAEVTAMIADVYSA